jgi:hypothetical protein
MKPKTITIPSTRQPSRNDMVRKRIFEDNISGRSDHVKINNTVLENIVKLSINPNYSTQYFFVNEEILLASITTVKPYTI